MVQEIEFESLEQLVVAEAGRTSPLDAVPPLMLVVVCLSLLILVASVMQAAFGTLFSVMVKLIPALTNVTAPFHWFVRVLPDTPIEPVPSMAISDGTRLVPEAP